MQVLYLAKYYIIYPVSILAKFSSSSTFYLAKNTCAVCSSFLDISLIIYIIQQALCFPLVLYMAAILFTCWTQRALLASTLALMLTLRPLTTMNLNVNDPHDG